MHTSISRIAPSLPRMLPSTVDTLASANQQFGGERMETRATPERVLEIVAMDDQPELRNLLITQTYHDLSNNLSDMLGSDDSNWCTFGCWASRTAGRFIRREEVAEALRPMIEASEKIGKHAKTLDSALSAVHAGAVIEHEIDGLLALPGKIVDEVSAYITGGNKVVFHELAHVFARFVETFGDDTEPDEEKLQAFLNSLEVGPTRPDKVWFTEDGELRSERRGGQSYLRDSMQNYHRAIFETDPDHKAELILLANAQGGLHEQTRLQTYIVGSLDAPIDDLLHDSYHGAIEAAGEDHPNRHEAHTVLGHLFHPLGDELRHLWERFSTVAMMQMKLPDGIIHLGHDVPALPGEPLYPEVLETIEDKSLREVLEHYGAYGEAKVPKGWLARGRSEMHEIVESMGLAKDDDEGSAASDWAKLSERMRFIFGLFRSRQQDTVLVTTPPFTEEQTAAILAGEMPEGPLY